MTDAPLPDRPIPQDDALRPPPANAPAPAPANGWAIVSLLCGVVGCLAVTPLVAIVAGGAGLRHARRTGVGGRMATIGLALGFGWLIFFGLTIAGGAWASRHGAMLIAEHERGRTVDLINRLPAGGLDKLAHTDPTSVDATVDSADRIGRARARELADVVKPLGVCRDVAIRSATFTNRDGVFGIEYDAVATFDRGQWPLRARLFFNGTGWGFSELDWQ